MEQQRDATTVDEPAGEPPDQDLAYDPTMTEGDEANIPPDSSADSTPGDEEQGADRIGPALHPGQSDA